MKPLAIFFHAALGPAPQIQPAHATGVFVELRRALEASGLMQAASTAQAGVTGGLAGYYLARDNSTPPLGLDPFSREEDCGSELPTLRALQRWLPGHEDAYVCYIHTKGASKPERFRDVWRRCMTDHVIWQWQRCVADLDKGAESVGCHWLTPERFGAAMLPTRTPYWAGNFWWAKASFLLTLPHLLNDAKARADFYLPERWIGEGPRRPIVQDYHPQWPSMQCAFA